MKIHYFNPGHEIAVMNTSPYYTAPANIVQMQQELAFLPAWYGEKDDIVLVGEIDNSAYYKEMEECFQMLPKAVREADLNRYNNREASLWGISPQAIHYFRELARVNNLDINIVDWTDEYTYLNSRLAARDCLEEIINKVPQISKALLPHFFSMLDDVENAVNSSRTRLLAKAPYSSSGRGLLWLPSSGLTRTERQILHGIIKKQGQVSVEQVLDKETDFAMEFICDGEGNLDFAGYSLFHTNSKGGYESNYIGSQENIEKHLAEKLSPILLTEIKNELIAILKEKFAHLYKGCIGVDMLIYKARNEYRLHPCLEINMRYNMGYLNLKLYENYISFSSQGRFHIGFCANTGSIYDHHNQMQEQYPPLFENHRLSKGYLPLCPVNKENKYWAYILIE